VGKPLANPPLPPHHTFAPPAPDSITNVSCIWCAVEKLTTKAKENPLRLAESP